MEKSSNSSHMKFKSLNQCYVKFEKYNIVSVCALESEFYVKLGKKKEEQDGDKRT